MKRLTLLITVVGALAVGAAALLGPRAHTTSRLAPALPSQVLVTPRVTVAKLRGKPALVNFWASWCDPCKREALAIEHFARNLRGRAQLVGVDWNDSASGAHAFIRRYRWTFPNLRDPDGLVGTDYGITGLPTTVVLDQQGRVATVLRGPQTVQALDRALAHVAGA